MAATEPEYRRTSQAAAARPGSPAASRRRFAPISLMLAPALMLFAVFILVPVVLTIVGSFFTLRPDLADLGASPASTTTSQAVDDPVFWLSLRNNLIIVFGSIVTADRLRHAARGDPRPRHPARLDRLPHAHLRADGHLVGRRRPDLADDPRSQHRAAEQDREVRSG